MRKFLLFGILGFSLLSSIAQTPALWGVTSQGGSSGWGTIYKMDLDGSNYTVMHNFDYTQGGTPMGSLVLAGDGNLYGSCYNGGIYGSCTVYRINPNTGVFTHLWDMGGGGSWADYPMGGMVEYNSALYGCASNGSIYRWDYILNQDADAYFITDYVNEGTLLVGEPLLIGDKLYGVAASNGVNNSGTLFQYDITLDVFTVLHSFDNPTGATPHGGVIMASDGNLYGMTFAGGANAMGTLYSYDPGTGTYTSLYDFDSASGGSPDGRLMETPDGLLYGMTGVGGSGMNGTIFSYDPVADDLEVVHAFDDVNGSGPTGELTRIGTKLMGTTSQGGTSDVGIIFSYDLITQVFTKLKDFDAVSGGNPVYGNFIAVGYVDDSGIEESNALAVKIYPTVSEGSVTISGISNGNLTIFDLAGNMTWSNQLTGPIAQVDLAIAAGTYVWNYSEDGKTRTGKIIVR
jgi:uncharacterized repeat protein (TIGR03803 family)